MTTKHPIDWRKLPRKPAELRRTVRIAFRLSPAEAARLKAAARQAGTSIASYVASCC